MMLECECIIKKIPDRSMALRDFEVVRQKCSALWQIIILDEIWPKYLSFCNSQKDEALHCPIAFWAYCRGSLGNFTAPIHRFLLEGLPPEREVTKQYRKDLVENWILQDNYNSRFEKSRIFQGRWGELCFALWLEQAGWRIENLEAYGGHFDVEAISSGGTKSAFEVKYFANEECLFELGVTANLHGGVAGSSMAVYSPLNYLLFRLYEASKKLEGYSGHNVAVVIITDYIQYYEIPLEESWIDWRQPKFIRWGQGIEPFLRDKFVDNPRLEEELQSYIASIDEIWIFHVGNLSIERKHIIMPKRAYGV